MPEHSSAYREAGKRLFDLFIAFVALALFLPVFLLIALILQLTSLGPVFYFQERVGRSERIFKIVKFRTMCLDADKKGPSITVGGDSRVTAFGRIMRALKIDELPQLWNVLKGEMSLVGPRPELLKYVKNYSAEQKQVLTVRPGMTDPASIAYRQEEELLAGQADPESYYQEVVLPHKLALNLQYIRRMSWRYDLALLAQTCFALLFKCGLLIYSVLAGKASTGTSWQIKSSN